MVRARELRKEVVRLTRAGQKQEAAVLTGYVKLLEKIFEIPEEQATWE